MIDAQEIWVSLIGYEGIYEISTKGRIKSIDRISGRGFTKGKLMSVWSKKGKYNRITLTDKNGIYKTHSVHRLVAISFIPNPLQKLYVNHIDGDKNNACVENLEWCTLNENMKHAFDTGLLNNNQMLKSKKGEKHPNAKLKDIDVLMIKSLAKSGFRNTVIAKRFGVHPTHVGVIVNMKSRKELEINL